MVLAINDPEVREAFQRVRENLAQRTHGISTFAALTGVKDSLIGMGVLKQLLERNEVRAEIPQNGGPLFRLTPKARPTLKLVVDNDQ